MKGGGWTETGDHEHHTEVGDALSSSRDEGVEGTEARGGCAEETFIYELGKQYSPMATSYTATESYGERTKSATDVM